jgi:hypothetical protein
MIGIRTLQPVEKVPVCHPEPGPELDSGSNDFRVSNTLIPSDAEMNSA